MYDAIGVSTKSISETIIGIASSWRMITISLNWISIASSRCILIATTDWK